LFDIGSDTKPIIRSRTSAAAHPQINWLAIKLVRQLQFSVRGVSLLSNLLDILFFLRKETEFYNTKNNFFRWGTP